MCKFAVNTPKTNFWWYWRIEPAILCKRAVLHELSLPSANIMAEKAIRFRRRHKSDSSTDEPAKRRPLAKRWPLLLDFKSLPKWMQDNEHIHSAYRPQMSSLRDCIVSGFSLFHMHNETINILSHFIGFLFFTGIALYTLLYATRSARFLANLSSQKVTTSLHTADELFRHLRRSGYKFWTEHVDVHKASPEAIKAALEKLLREHRFGMAPMLVGSILCMLSSTLYHTFWVYSDTALAILAKIDYTCIALLTSGHMQMGISSGFFCRPELGQRYQILVVIATAVVVYVVFNKDFSTPKFRTKRTLVFCGLGAVVVVPITHLSVLHGFSHPEWYSFCWSLIRTSLFYIGSALLFASRFPECCRPGKYDKYGASHQLMHFTVIAGAFVHWYDTLSAFNYRMENGCSLSPL